MNPEVWPPLPNINLIGIDPGETTGIIEIVSGKLHRSMSVNYEWLMDNMAEEELGWVPAEPGFSAVPYELWVVENFLIYPWKAEQLAFNVVVPAKLIGAIELYIRNFKPRPRLVLQTAQNAKHLIKDEVIDHYLGKGVLGSRHEKDAARHALYYLVTTTFAGRK